MLRKPSRAVSSLAGYAILLGLAWWVPWTPGDLAWGLWVSGFAMLALWVIIMAVLRCKEARFNPGMIGAMAIGTGLLGWALVWLYSFYGEMLDLGFPLVPDPGRVYVGGTTWRNVRAFEFWPTATAAVREFYAVIAVTLLPFIAGLKKEPLTVKAFWNAPGLSGASLMRLHLTVMALIFLQIGFQEKSPRNGFWFSAAILTINFFPWELLAKKPAIEQGAAPINRR